MRFVLSFMLVTLIGPGVNTASCEYYKCVDKNGQYHFSDSPSSLPEACVEKSSLKVPRSSSANYEATSAKYEKWKEILPGSWEFKGIDKSGDPFTTLWVFRQDGTFSGENRGVLDGKPFSFLFSGEWEISDYDELVSTYTWSSLPLVLSPGTKDTDKIIELTKTQMTLRGGKSGTISKYIRIK